jgi:hypothetical protein
MDPAIIAAIIGLVGAIVVAIIAARWKKPNKPAERGEAVTVGNVNAGRDAIVAGRGAIVVQQQIHETRFISKDGAKLITQVSKEIIRDEQLRWRWSSFDVEVLGQCIKDTPRGITFDGAAFKAFKKPENDELFDLGVRIYLECCKRIGDQTNSDYNAFNKIAQIYVTASYLLRGGVP